MKTEEFRERIAKGERLDHILPEAYALVKEAAVRTLGYGHYDVQLMGGIALHKGYVAEMKTGEGKEAPVDTPVPTPEGWKRLGDIRVGDTVFDRTGMPTKVEGVYPQGMKEVYELELEDGRTIECGAKHLWTVYPGYGRGNPETMMTEEMLAAGPRTKHGCRFRLPASGCAQYGERHFRIDPYVMGLFLGNGCKNAEGTFELSTDDEECVKEAARLLGVTSYKRQSQENDSWCFHREDGNKKLKVKDLDGGCAKLLSRTHSSDRYIPDEYKTSSEEQRWALVQGLMDSNGNICEEKANGQKKRFNMQYCTTSERLKDGFMEVLYSLGCSCSWSFGERAGNGTAKHDQYVVRIHVPNSVKPNFFRIGRKKKTADKSASYIPKKKDYSKIAIIGIRRTGRLTEQVCIAVDNPERLFLIGKYIVTHNTLVSTCPAYLNALSGKPVHIVTVNDYLAQRDAEWMGRIHRLLGLSVGCVLQPMAAPQRRAAYACDITYVTNSELGFDYLRDNMAGDRRDMVLRGLEYCIIDEADSVLIDEARTPLIISGPSEKVTKLYGICDVFVRQLVPNRNPQKFSKTAHYEEDDGDFIVDEEDDIAALTASGVEKAERFFGIRNISDPENTDIMHHIILAIRANYLMQKNVDYIVTDGEVKIVDEFTGRVMEGRRYADGLHQAIEAKEHVEVNGETKTYATITLQNFFNKFKKKSGMTGTAYSEKKEFRETYGMDVVRIPTNRPVIRDDRDDKVFKTKEQKYAAVIRDLLAAHRNGQPVLVGTTSVEASEDLSAMLRKEGVAHSVLNAKRDAEEAAIIERAGEAGAVTIATNMAGRGTDIKLSDESKAAGGLKVIGTERHESRRIDDQLRGRSGRQGDPGDSRFFLSMEDDLITYNCDEKRIDEFKSFKCGDDGLIESKKMNRFVKKAQKKEEYDNFGIRENLLEFDNISNSMREAVYSKRLEIIDAESVHDEITEIIRETVIRRVEKIVKRTKETDYKKLQKAANRFVDGFIDSIYLEGVKRGDIAGFIAKKAVESYEAAKKRADAAKFDDMEKRVYLAVIDSKWMQHLEDMEKLKDVISYKAIGQRDPVVEYRTASAKMFDAMFESVRNDVAENLNRLAKRD